MTNEEQPLSFPNYQPPNPQGIPVADPKFHKPLFKLIRQLAKPKTKAIRRTNTKPHRKKKRINFY